MNSLVCIHIFIRILLSLIPIYYYCRHLSGMKPFNFRHKRVEIVCGIFLLSFFFFGCLPSLHPLYTEDTLIFDEQLIGKWYIDDDIWSFVKNRDNGYDLHIIEADGQQTNLVVHLLQLGEHRFIDLYPQSNLGLENTSEMSRYNLLPVHTFMKIELSDPNLKLQWVYLGDLIEKDPNVLKHELMPENKRGDDTFEDDTILITASSKDLQRVILEHLEDVLAGDEGKLRRFPSLFSENNIVFEEGLLGQWETEDKELLEICRSENNRYTIVSTRKNGQKEHYEGILYRFQNQTFLSFIKPMPSKIVVDTGLYIIPDIFVRIDPNETEFKSWTIDWRELDNYKEEDGSYNFDALCSEQPATIYKKDLKQDDNIEKDISASTSDSSG